MLDEVHSNKTKYPELHQGFFGVNQRTGEIELFRVRSLNIVGKKELSGAFSINFGTGTIGTFLKNSHTTTFDNTLPTAIAHLERMIAEEDKISVVKQRELKIRLADYKTGASGLKSKLERTNRNWKTLDSLSLGTELWLVSKKTVSIEHGYLYQKSLSDRFKKNQLRYGLEEDTCDGLPAHRFFTSLEAAFLQLERQVKEYGPFTLDRDAVKIEEVRPS